MKYDERKIGSMVTVAECVACVLMLLVGYLFDLLILKRLGWAAFILLSFRFGAELLAFVVPKRRGFKRPDVIYTLVERIAFDMCTWLWLGLTLYLWDPAISSTLIVGHVGSYQITPEFLGDISTFSVFVAVAVSIPPFIRISRYNKEMQREMLMQSSGEVISWQDGKGKVRVYSSTYSKAARRLGSRTMKAISTEPLAVGVRIKVVGVDKKMKILEVAKQDTEPEPDTNVDGGAKEKIPLHYWIIAALALWLISVAIPSEHFSWSFLLLAVITALLGLLTSTRLRKIYSSEVLAKLTWQRQLVIWLAIALLLFLDDIYDYYLINFLAESIAGSGDVSNK